MTTDRSPGSDAQRPRPDDRMRVAIKAVLIAGGGLAGAGLALSGIHSGVSVAAGAALAAGNLWALARVVTSLLPEESDGAAAQGKGAWILVGVLKTAGLLVAAWLVLSYRLASPLPMLVGFTSLPIGIAIGALVSDRRPQPKEPR